MREILFKGKRKDNGEWVEGFYVCLKDDYKNKISHRIYPGYAETDCGVFYPDWFEVDPETVCQYTVLKDKNGKKIFEGDIVDTVYDIEYIGVAAKRIGKSVVKFHKGCFVKDKIGEAGLFHFIASDKEKVIGNIFDNPELLEVTE